MTVEQEADPDPTTTPVSDSLSFLEKKLEEIDQQLIAYDELVREREVLRDAVSLLRQASSQPGGWPSRSGSGAATVETGTEPHKLWEWLKATNRVEPSSAVRVGEAAEARSRSPNSTQQDLGKLLRAGLVQKAGRGRYYAVDPVSAREP